MDIKSQWEELCGTVRSHGEACAQASPEHAETIRTEAAAFCAQDEPQSTPAMQMRQLSFAGTKGWWASRVNSNGTSSQ